MQNKHFNLLNIKDPFNFINFFPIRRKVYNWWHMINFQFMLFSLRIIINRWIIIIIIVQDINVSFWRIMTESLLISFTMEWKLCLWFNHMFGWFLIFRTHFDKFSLLIHMLSDLGVFSWFNIVGVWKLAVHSLLVINLIFYYLIFNILCYFIFSNRFLLWFFTLFLLLLRFFILLI